MRKAGDTGVQPLSLPWQGWIPARRHFYSHSYSTPKQSLPGGHLCAGLLLLPWLVPDGWWYDWSERKMLLHVKLILITWILKNTWYWLVDYFWCLYKNSKVPNQYDVWHLKKKFLPSRSVSSSIAEPFFGAIAIHHRCWVMNSTISEMIQNVSCIIKDISSSLIWILKLIYIGG